MEELFLDHPRCCRILMVLVKHLLILCIEILGRVLLRLLSNDPSASDEIELCQLRHNVLRVEDLSSKDQDSIRFPRFSGVRQIPRRIAEVRAIHLSNGNSPTSV